MTATVEEKHNGRRGSEGNNPTNEVQYIIRGANYETDAKLALLAHLTTSSLLTYDGKVLGSYDVDEIATATWTGTAKYVPLDRQKPQAGDWYCSIDTTGSTQNIKYSKKTTAYAPSGGTAPKTNGLIGNNGETVDGVDWPDRSFKFTITGYFNPGGVTQAYLEDAYLIQGCVNDAEWSFQTKNTSMTFAAGEARFLGYTYNDKSDPPSIDFHFDGSPNATNIKIPPDVDGVAPAGQIVVTTKKGWEYLWLRYKATSDSTAKVMTQQAEAAYVEQVGDEADFAALLIPEPTP